MAGLAPPESVKELAQKALQANKDHQYALRKYTERLEAELKTVDKLLATSELPEDDIEVDAGGSVVVPGAVRAVGLIPHDRLFEYHPFAEEAERRQRYLQATVIHPMKAPELETLAEAVRAENYRIYALDAQRRGRPVLLDPEAKPETFLNTNKIGINWERVASKVSAAGSSSNVRRTEQECEIRWLGDRHPEINHAPWSQDENARVKELVGDATEGSVDWVDIASRLGTNRTPLDCMRHAIPRRQHVWTPESDKRLLDAVQIYGTGSWMLVARHVSEDATAAQCQNRYTRSLDPAHRRGTWSEEEDEQLRHAVEVFGRSWVEVCTFVPTRSSEQCRDRWQEVLHPGGGRGRWSSDEDEALLEAYRTVGEGRWREISAVVGHGRTDNMCRHRYAALIKRQSKSATASTSASASASVRTSPTPDASRTATPTPAPEQPARSEAEAQGAAEAQATPQVDASNDAEPAATEPASAPHPAPGPKPRPKPRPRRRAAVPTDTTVSEVQAASAVQPASTLVSAEPVSDVQPAPKRRGRPPKAVADSEETGPPAKKRRTKGKGKDKDKDNDNPESPGSFAAAPTTAAEASTSVVPVGEEGTSASSRAEGNGRQETRRQKSQSQDQSQGEPDVGGVAPVPAAEVDEAANADGVMDVDVPGDLSGVNTTPGNSSVTIEPPSAAAESGSADVRESDAYNGDSPARPDGARSPHPRKRGRGRSNAVPPADSARTLRSASRKVSNPDREVQGGQP